MGKNKKVMITYGDLIDVCRALRREDGWILSWCRGFMGFDFDEADEAVDAFLVRLNDKIVERFGAHHEV